MNFVERIAKWVGVDVSAANRPEVVNFRAAIEAARAAKRAENYAEALDSFDRAAGYADQLGDDSGLAIVRLHRADIYTRLGKFDDAERLIEMVMRAGETGTVTSTKAYAKVAQGALELARGEIERARNVLEDARDYAPKARQPGAEGRALGYLAETFLGEGNASYAAHLLREAIPKLNMSGDLELAAYFMGLLAQALLVTGDTLEADQLLSRAMRFAEQMKLRGDLRRLNMILAKRALELGRYAESYNHYERALQYTDDDVPERAEALRDVATACLYLDKSQDALVYAERAVALRPDNPAMRGTLGVILQSVGRAEDALPHLEAAMNSEVVDYDTRRALAAAYADAGRPEDSLKTLETALELASKADLSMERARTLRDIGHQYARQRQYTEAIKTWTAAFDLYEAQGVAAQAARLLCDIANTRLMIGQSVRAHRDFEQALMLINNADDLATRGVVLSNAATIYVEKGDLETAEAFFTESIQVAQKTHDSAAEATRRGNLGWFLLNTGRYERARTALEHALERSERYGLHLQVAVQNSNLAQTATELGDNDAAIKLHERALAIIDTQQSPRWQSIIRTEYANLLVKLGDYDQARKLLDEALERAPHEEDAEAHTRAMIGLILLDARTDAALAWERVSALLPQMRARGSKRLLADTLAAASEVRGAQGKQDEARNYWDEAAKFYQTLGHPTHSHAPQWLAQTQR